MLTLRRRQERSNQRSDVIPVLLTIHQRRFERPLPASILCPSVYDCALRYPNALLEGGPYSADIFSDPYPAHKRQRDLDCAYRSLHADRYEGHLASIVSAL